jgi:hypothetical protein
MFSLVARCHGACGSAKKPLILMVDTEAELRREDAAITQDLMSAGVRTVRKLRAPAPFLLGRVDTRCMLDSVAEFDRVAQDLADAEMRQQQLETAQDRAPIEAIGAAKADLSAVEEVIREATAEKGRIEGALQDMREAIGAVERSIADLRDKVEGSLAYPDRVMVALQVAERRAVLIAEGDPGCPEFDRVLMEEEFALIKHPVDDPRWLPAALEHLDGYVLFRNDKRLAGTEDAFLESIREYLRRSTCRARHACRRPPWPTTRRATGATTTGWR